MKPVYQILNNISFLRFLRILALVYLSVFLTSCNFFRNDENLAIVETSDISFIGIYGQDTLEIERTGENWEMNTGREPDPVALDNFLYAFKNLEKTGATSGKGIDSLYSRKIWIQAGNRKRIYRFYYSDDNFFLHHEGSTNIYRIKVKSSPDADLKKIFSDRPSDWDKRLIINISPGEIEEVRVDPGNSFGEGFIMKRDSNGFKLYTLDGEVVRKDSLNEEKTLLYSSYFSEIYYIEEIHDDSISDRIRKDTPFYIFNIRTSGGNESEIQVYPLYEPEGNTDIFHGAITLNRQDRILRLNYVYLDPLFQNLSYFSVK
jgi:hypothetical protein